MPAIGERPEMKRGRACGPAFLPLRSLLFGFKDDVVIRVTPSGIGSRVDVRSLSRMGGSDIGANADRIRAFLSKLKADASVR